MNLNSRTQRLASAILFGVAAATVALQAVQAEELKKADETLVDTRTTGSIPFAKDNCDPADANAGIVCRVTRGEPGVKYPSAPVNPSFGF